VIVRGVRNTADRTQEYTPAAMNQTLEAQTQLLPARPELAPVSSTVVRGPHPDDEAHVRPDPARTGRPGLREP
jgi:phosphopantetheine adenylyltransferase